MNKFGMILGVAAVATVAGCKDPDYQYGGGQTSQDEVKSAETTVVVEPAPVITPVKPVKEPAPIVVEDVKADASAPVEAKSAPMPEPEVTEYIVQRGDYLAKISKKFNVRVDAIRKLNPSIKKDVIRIGQKLKLPGKIEVGEQKVPEGAFAKPVKKAAKVGAKKAAYAPYTGATKEYVVKSGDTLGAIAYSNGINIRQLKELNALKNNNLKIGQKLKVPAEKVVAAKAAETAPVAKAEAAKPAEVAAPAEEAVPAAPVVAPAEVAPAPAAAEEVASPAEAEAAAPAQEQPAANYITYTVKEGEEDIHKISINWGVSAAVIRELNNLPDDAKLTPGQVIKLPPEAEQ